MMEHFFESLCSPGWQENGNNATPAPSTADGGDFCTANNLSHEALESIFNGRSLILGHLRASGLKTFRRHARSLSRSLLLCYFCCFLLYVELRQYKTISFCRKNNWHGNCCAFSFTRTRWVKKRSNFKIMFFYQMRSFLYCLCFSIKSGTDFLVFCLENRRGVGDHKDGFCCQLHAQVSW